jgi:hypothetical protein
MPETTLVLSGTLGNNPVPAAGFGTVVEEIRAVLGKIRAEVRNGMDPADVMISVASPESVLPILEREARIAGVPLDVREGSPLSDSTGGRLLTDIIGLASSRMSFEAMRKLLLDASRSWKEKEAAGRLLRIGIEKHIIAPMPAGGSGGGSDGEAPAGTAGGSPGGADIWEASLGNDDEARRLYRGLKTASSRVMHAHGFSTVRTAYDAFKRAFLEDSWSDRQNDEIARSLAVLDELGSAADTLGLADITDAAQVWADMLGETRYLPVSGSGGIAVYRFPVAAGARPALHFILNLAEGEAVAAARPLAFMRADERQKAGASDRDISAGLIRLLAESGTRVYMSYSENGPDGVRPPHPAVAIKSPELLGVPYERKAWFPNLEAEPRQKNDDKQHPVEAFPSQVTSASIALHSVFRSKESDWTEGTPGKPFVMATGTATALRDSLLHDGTLSLSVTTIDGYLSCAFKRVFSKQLRVEALESGLSFIDNLLVGNLYHDAFKRLFEPLAKDGLPILHPALGQNDTGEDQAVAGETARPSGKDITAALFAAIDAVERTHGAMARVLLLTSAPVLERAFRLSAGNLLAVLDGYIPVLVDEKELFAPLQTLEATLRGRPDLVCAKEDAGKQPKAIIMDYKKNKIPGKAELSLDESGSIEVLQIPAYTVLVAHAGLYPTAAYYLSIEGSEPGGKGLRLVYGPGKDPCIAEKQLPQLEPALVMAAGQTLKTIRGGYVYIPDISDQGEICKRCDLRPVCRTHYAVR